MRRLALLTALTILLSCVALAATTEERDAEVEAFLLEAEVVSSEEIGSGISKPKKLVLELDGRTMKAAFKDISVEHSNRKVRVGNEVMLMFTDDYRYERAAYLLDRKLGMNMVPVAVLRAVDGDKGAVIEWVSGGVNEMERRSQELVPENPAVLNRQRDIMKIFDLLILNDDRNLANQLIIVDDWQLRLIDHSRSFRLEKRLPKGLEAEPLALPRWLFDAIQELELEEMTELFRGLMGKSRVKAMLARRDKLVLKIERDREQYGDVMVFHEAFAEATPE